MDARSLFEKQKTGIDWTIEKIISHIEIEPQNEYWLNYFALRKKKQKRLMMEPYVRRGYKLRICGFFSFALYRRIWNVIPIPYSWFMGRDTDITQFFNYVIPPGVKGEKALYVYDMVYRACPETMEETTRMYMERNVENSCRRADFIITISEFSKNEIIKYLEISSERIYVVPCGVDLSVYNPNINERKVAAVRKKFQINRPYYLYLGTLEPRKNIAMIVNAYCKVKEKKLDKLPQLVIAGKRGWGYQELFEMVQKYGLQEDIIFTDYISEEEKPPLLKGAICFLFPSLYEGFGMPPLEAMACGTPVIVSDQASLPEVVGDAGILVNPQDSEMMARHMKRLYDEPDYRKQLSQKCRKQAERFTWKIAASKLMEVYETILDKSK